MIGRKNRINPFSESRYRSRRSGGVLLLIGVLAGVTVGGGVGVIAASTTKSVTVCANKKTNMLRYAKNGKCAKTETKVLLNQTGADGSAGAKGDTGTAGSIGATGAKGADGAAGTKGDKGDAGTAAAASSPTGFTARSVCGSEGTTLCAVGVQGPGRGTIIYVDLTNEIAGYDYLEVAPTDGVFGSTAATGAWSTRVAKCGTEATSLCDRSFLSDASTALGYIGLGTGRAATAAIVARHDAGAVAKNLYAAGVADAYTTATASDWFLPSRDELNEVCKYERNTGQAAGASIICAGLLGQGGSSASYWSSSEFGLGAAWIQRFNSGVQLGDFKLELGSENYVRPVRSF